MRLPCVASPHIARDVNSWLKLGCVALLATLMSACSKSALPEYGQIGQFALTNADGQPFTQAKLDGKVWVAAFMFTRCPSICPRMMGHMRTLQDHAKQQGVTLSLVSFSVDPENDTPPVLRQFAERYGADLSNWAFLTGEHRAIRDASVNGFKLALEGTADANKADFGILHSAYLVLVDQRRYVRGYYDVTEEGALDRLLADADALQ